MSINKKGMPAMTTKTQLSTIELGRSAMPEGAIAAHLDTLSAQALEACTGGDGKNDELRGYTSPLRTGLQVGALVGSCDPLRRGDRDAAMCAD